MSNLFSHIKPLETLLCNAWKRATLQVFRSRFSLPAMAVSDHIDNSTKLQLPTLTDTLYGPPDTLIF